MHNVWTVFKKEVYRVFSDRRLVLSVFILPGLSIFIIYSIMGSAIESQIDQQDTHVYQIHIEGAVGDRINTLMDSYMNYEPHDINQHEGGVYLDRLVEQGEIDLVILFPDDFEYRVENYDSTPIPEITFYYNEGRQESVRAYSQMNHVLSIYHQEIVRERLDEPSDYDVYTQSVESFIDERSVTGQSFAMLMPMLIIIFLFAGAMSIGPDAIAGEKERGTIATLLVTPIKRSHLALGKVFSLSFLALISALSSFIGIILSLPRLMAMDDSIQDLSVYGIGDYVFILALLMATVLFIVSLISLISAYAKTIKEASMLIMPFYFIAIIAGVMNSFGAEASDLLIVHLIPIYGTVNILSAILTFEYSMLNLVVSIASMLGYTVIFIIILNKMFNSEKVMFQK